MIGTVVIACGVLYLGSLLYRHERWRYFVRRAVRQERRRGGALTGGGPAEPCLRVTSAGVASATPIHALQAGDSVLVRSGELIPADGIITAGVAWVAAQQRGSERQVKKVHQRVYANHLVLAGSIVVLVEPQVGETDALE